ncbi:helix-turn-helix transcriptional regulator [Streptomyces sp. DSM 42041]|uniref:Helix-turn-helix transcriptional regulator n=1 Tax=Streptomyces hazeniae TaxID=3075538 RepID=A0ABU2NM60_9ACTN|nr:helix-turn-helix transcriptional regulator [Streptomyces sp. DSM 42041]MDT0377318.1 helix-turn-helix transcriptional regulator [Streptomyces sp. DSM 42041]
MTAPRRRRPRRPLNQEPEAVTYAREKAGLTKRALAEQCGISPQLMGEIESGWRNATPRVLLRLAEALNCPLVVLEAKRTLTPTPAAEPAPAAAPPVASVVPVEAGAV